MKITVYTCVTKNYEQQVAAIPAYSWLHKAVLFTNDRRITARGWENHDLFHPANIGRPDLINRYHKLFPYRVLGQTDVSVYVDGNIKFLADPYPLVTNFLKSNAQMALFKHPQRENVVQELEACKALKKFKGDDESRSMRQIRKYEEEGFPRDYPLFAAGVIIRRHPADLRLDHAMSVWWREIQHYTARDQLSLPYVLWNTNVPYVSFEIDIFKNKYFVRNQRGTRTFFERAKKAVSKFVR